MASSGVVGVPLGTESEVARGALARFPNPLASGHSWQLGSLTRGALARVNPPGAFGRRVCEIYWGHILNSLKTTFTDPTESPEDKEELICFGRKLPPVELS